MKTKGVSRWQIGVWLMILLVVGSLCACSSMEEKRDKFMNSGKDFYQKGDYVRARLQFQNALQIDPKFAAALLWQAKTDLNLKNPRGAFGALNRAVDLDPHLTEAQILLGEIFLVAKQLDKSQEKTDIALKQDPKNIEALMLSASLAVAQGQPKRALETVVEVRRLNPQKISAYLLASAILMREKKPDEAAAILEEGIKANPKSLNLYIARSGLADSQQQFETGESFLLKAIEVEPQDIDLVNHLVRHYSLTRQWDKAEEALRKAVALDPDSEKPLIMLSKFLVSQRRAKEAETTLQNFIKARPDNYPARFSLADFYLAQRRQGPAEKVLADIVKKDPDGPQGVQAKNGLAAMQLAQGHMADAEKLVNEILKDHPKDVRANEIRGIIALNKKDGLTAVNSFRLLTQDQPKNAQFWLLLARAHLVHKEDTQARENAKKALEIAPDLLDARKFLYGMYLQAKDYDGLINLIQGYLRYNDKDIFNLVALGDIYALKGDYAPAKATFQAINAVDPKSPQGYYQLALLGIKMKKLDEALQFADKALQVQPTFLPALQLMVGIYQEQKQPDKALAAVRQHLARNPKNPQLQQLLGEVLLIQKQPQAAIEPLEAALRLNPRQVEALRLLALAYLQMPEADKAVQQLADKAADPHASPILSLVLATVYEGQGKYDKAIDLYNSLLARNLFPSLARNNQAYLIAEHQATPENLKRAQKLAAETLEDNPEEPSFLDTMGWILCKQGNYVEAKTYLEKALGPAPHPAMLYHLAWCQAKLGESAAARENLQKALESKAGFKERQEAEKLLASLSAAAN